MEDQQATTKWEAFYELPFGGGLKFNGELAQVLIHELLHAYIAKNYPGFASDEECNDCEHQFVFSVTASGMCDKAQDCNQTLAERQEAQTIANIDNKLCEELSEEMVCDDCSQTKPPIPPCPGPCSLPECN